MSKITMPFFQATSTKLPLKREVASVDDAKDLPSAGPYTYTRNEPNRLTSIRKNPYWRRGPGRDRPRNLDGVDVLWSLNEQTAFEQVKNNELDAGPLPAAEVQSVANQYGVNRSRFWAMPQGCLGFLPMNLANDLFRGNLRLRQAINYAIDPAGLHRPGGRVRRHSLDPHPHAGGARLEEREPLSARPGPPSGARAGGRTLPRREDHGLLPLVGYDEPGSGPDREARPAEPRFPGQQHHDEGLLGRRHLHRLGRPRQRRRHRRFHGLVLRLSGPGPGGCDRGRTHQLAHELAALVAQARGGFEARRTETPRGARPARHRDHEEARADRPPAHVRQPLLLFGPRRPEEPGLPARSTSTGASRRSR